MRRLLPFVVPLVAVLALALGGWVWVERDAWFAPPGAPVDVTFETLGAERFVRLEGMAHYGSTIQQKSAGTLLQEPKTWYVFGFFPTLDTTSRAIRVLVRTQRKPDEIVGFEVMTIEGALSPPDTRTIPPSTEAMLSKRSEYWFADDVLVLTPTRILSEDGVWEEP